MFLLCLTAVVLCIGKYLFNLFLILCASDSAFRNANKKKPTKAYNGKREVSTS